MGPGPWASSCRHKHYVGDKNGKTFKNLGAQPQTDRAPWPGVNLRVFWTSTADQKFPTSCRMCRRVGLFKSLKITYKTRICTAEMAVRYAALSACRKVHVCHCNSLGGATWRSVTITGRTDRWTDRQTDRRTDRVRRNMRPPPREEGRIIKPDLSPVNV